MNVRRVAAQMGGALALVAGLSMEPASGQVPHAGPLPRLTVAGKHLVGPDGKPVLLRGLNLGGWLVIETWMIDWAGVPDQYTAVSVLGERFGADEAARLLEAYRRNFITQRDFDRIKAMGFGVVRIPFGWDMVQSDAPPFGPRADAFVHLNRALEMAERAGLYVILDLHAAPGGQSQEHHTMRAGQNKLFTSEPDLTRTVEVWRAVAARYRGRSVVVAYDLLNEPYGDFRTDLRGPLVSLMDRLYAAVRESDPDTLVLFPGTHSGSIEHYGDPAARGLRNVGFTEHFYPGLFGDVPRPHAHLRTIRGRYPDRAAYLARLNVPYLVGEFNVVLERAGGDAMMRRHFDAFAEHGWMATAWSYKLLKPAGGVGPDNWYFVTNAEPMPRLDLRAASKTEIEAWIASLGTQPLATDEKLIAALKAATPPELVVPPVRGLPTTVPSDAVPAGWTLTPVGGDRPAGGYQAKPEGLAATGADIWDRADSFAYLHRGPTEGDFEATVRVNAMGESHAFAKGGLMVRAGTEAGAAHVMVNVFPDGSVGFSTRPAAGATTTEKQFEPGAAAAFPVRLRLSRRGTTVTAAYARAGGTWTEVGSHTLPAGAVLAGLAVCSHDPWQPTLAEYAGLRVERK